MALSAVWSACDCDLVSSSTPCWRGLHTIAIWFQAQHLADVVCMQLRSGFKLNTLLTWSACDCDLVSSSTPWWSGLHAIEIWFQAQHLDDVVCIRLRSSFKLNTLLADVVCMRPRSGFKINALMTWSACDCDLDEINNQFQITITNSIDCWFQITEIEETLHRSLLLKPFYYRTTRAHDIVLAGRVLTWYLKHRTHLKKIRRTKSGRVTEGLYVHCSLNAHTRSTLHTTRGHHLPLSPMKFKFWCHPGGVNQCFEVFKFQKFTD